MLILAGIAVLIVLVLILAGLVFFAGLILMAIGFIMLAVGLFMYVRPRRPSMEKQRDYSEHKREELSEAHELQRSRGGWLLFLGFVLACLGDALTGLVVR